MLSRRSKLVLLLLVIVLLGDRIRQRRESIARMRDEAVDGRGRGPRAAQRRFPPIDVYSSMLPKGDFRGVTRFSRQQFDEIVQELIPYIIQNRHVRSGVEETSGELRPTKLSQPNRVLMTIKFLVFGSTLEDLAQQFGYSVPAVREDIHHVATCIVEALHYEISWPDGAQRQALRDIMGPGFAQAFGQSTARLPPRIAGLEIIQGTAIRLCARIRLQRTAWAISCTSSPDKSAHGMTLSTFSGPSSPICWRRAAPTFWPMWAMKAARTLGSCCPLLPRPYQIADSVAHTTADTNGGARALSSSLGF